MTVVAFVGDVDEAQSVVFWGGRFAASRDAELIIFYVPGRELDPAGTRGTTTLDQFQDETQAAVANAVESIVRVKHARKGRLPRHAVSVRPITDVDPVAGTVNRLRVESPALFIGAQFGEWTGPKSVARQIAARIPYAALLLAGAADTTPKSKRIVVATSDGAHDKHAVDLGALAANVVTGAVSVVAVEASVGEQAIQVGERQLRGLLRELEIEESKRLEVKVVLGEEWDQVITEEAAGSDLLIIGLDKEKYIPTLLEKDPQTAIGVFRRATRPAYRNQRAHGAWLLPQINPTDYADLYEQLQTGSRWNSDFVFMLGSAAAIATLGLIQNSPAVVIGSMLLAPLMTPMIGMGLALNQGNSKLAQSCSRAIGRGFCLALVISVLLGMVTPGIDLTPEIVGRTNPNILDLLIAVFSGAAAAYALARPSLMGTVAGVAIATALVPPLCAAGICLSYFQLSKSLGALCLLVANVLAIILAAAATFRAMGLKALTVDAPRRFWVRNVVAGLTLAVLAIGIPLGSAFLAQVHEGKDAPYAFALTSEMRQALLDHADSMPGVEIIYAGRAGIDREEKPVDIGIILSSTYPLPAAEENELVELIRTTMQNPNLSVRVECVASGWADETSDSEQ